MIRNTFLAFASFVFLLACGSETNTSTVGSSGNPPSRSAIDLRPPAVGAPGEIYFVIDPEQWDGPLGDELRRTFSIRVPGLPQPEPMFTVRHLAPQDMSKTFRVMKNLVYVATLDNNSRSGKYLRRNFTDASIQEIEQDPTKFQYIKTDEFAIGQKVVHLFGRTEDALLKNIVDHREQLRQYFIGLEHARLAEVLFKVRETGVENRLKQNHQVTIKVPRGYELAHEEENFMWVRRRDQMLDVDRGVFIYHEPYTDETVFTEEGMKKLRDRITTKHVRDVQKPSIVMERQTEMFDFSEINFHGKYAVEIRGLWRLSDISLGGPYVAYAMVDEARGRLIYFEGYVAAPGTEKRPYMTEMEVILDTFRVAAENPGS